MSRGFVKEDDQEEIPMVSPWADLSFGVVNYVTVNGLKELMFEQNLLVEEQKTLIEQSNEINRVQINYITAKLARSFFALPRSNGRRKPIFFCYYFRDNYWI